MADGLRLSETDSLKLGDKEIDDEGLWLDDGLREILTLLLLEGDWLELGETLGDKDWLADGEGLLLADSLELGLSDTLLDGD